MKTTKTTFNLSYNWKMDLIWSIFVNLGGEALAVYFFCRIKPYSCWNYDILFWSTFIGYIGISLLFIIWKIQGMDQMNAHIYVLEDRIEKAVDFRGRELKECNYWRIEQDIIQASFGCVDIIFYSQLGKEQLRIKNISSEIVPHLLNRAKRTPRRL